MGGRVVGQSFKPLASTGFLLRDTLDNTLATRAFLLLDGSMLKFGATAVEFTVFLYFRIPCRFLPPAKKQCAAIRIKLCPKS